MLKPGDLVKITAPVDENNRDKIALVLELLPYSQVVLILLDEQIVGIHKERITKVRTDVS